MKLPVLHPADRQEVEEGAECPVPDPVFRLAEAAGPVMDGDLEDAESSHLEQGRNESVEAPVQHEISQAFSPECAKRAPAILDRLLAQTISDPVGHARG